MSRSRSSVQAQHRSFRSRITRGVAVTALWPRTNVTLNWRIGNQTLVSASVNTVTHPRSPVNREWRGTRIAAGVCTCAIRNHSSVVQIRYDHHGRNIIRQNLCNETDFVLTDHKLVTSHYVFVSRSWWKAGAKLCVSFRWCNAFYSNRSQEQLAAIQSGPQSKCEGVCIQSRSHSFSSV